MSSDEDQGWAEGETEDGSESEAEWERDSQMEEVEVVPPAPSLSMREWRERDLLELDLLPPLWSRFNPHTSTLRLGLPISAFPLEYEQARAWGLDGLHLCVYLQLSPHYFGTSASDVRVEVGVSDEEGEANITPPLRLCRLSWVLRERIRKRSVIHTSSHISHHY